MDGQSELLTRLSGWAASAAVTPTWVRGVLRLQSSDGTAKAVVTFPAGFWDAYPKVSHDRRRDAMDVIVGDIHALYDSDWKQFEAKNIEVHSALLREV